MSLPVRFRSLRIAAYCVVLLSTLEMPMTAQANTLPDIDSLWDYNDPAATQVKFQELLPRAQSEEYLAYRTELLTQLARTHGLQRAFDSAHAILDQVEPLLDLSGDRVRIRYLLERGRTYNSSGDKTRAATLFAEAMELAQEVDQQTLAVDAAHMLAIAIPDEAMAWNLRALEMAEAATEPGARRWRGSLYNNLGWTHFDRAQYDSALTMFEQALAFREEQKLPREALVARWCVAKCQRYLGHPDVSLTEQLSLEAAWKEAGEPDGYVFEEIAECLLAMDRAAEARPYFAKAYERLSKDAWLTEHESERLERLERLSHK